MTKLFLIVASLALSGCTVVEIMSYGVKSAAKPVTIDAVAGIPFTRRVADC